MILSMLPTLFRTWQVIENIASRGFTLLMIEITVGLLAIVPTLNVIACIESRTDSYVPETDDPWGQEEDVSTLRL